MCLWSIAAACIPEGPLEVDAPLLHQVDDTLQTALQAHGNVQERSVLVQLGPDATVTITRCYLMLSSKAI